VTLALLVDDQDTNLYYLETLLKGNGWQVATARDGAQALAAAERRPPDLVVSDLLMPVMDGYTLLRHWKAHPRLQAIPFVVYTATYTDAEDEQLALDLGADGFILKPAEPDAFLRRLAEVMARPRATQAKPAAATPEGEVSTLTAYNQALVRKLEDKTRQLEQANQALRSDIARREAAEAALRISEERFRLLVQATADAAWDWDRVAGTRWWSPGFGQLAGNPQAVDESDRDWQQRVHPEDRDWVLATREDAIAGGEDTWLVRYRLRRDDGSWLQVEDRGHLIRDSGGQVVRMVGGLTDITRRVSLEEKLQRSQRLEALGQLTGGVAHDFNNLLTVVLGNAQVLAEELPRGSGLGDLAQMIVAAALRGAELTKRLLAFASKQTLTPRGVDLNQLVTDLAPLLHRALGDHVEVDLVTGNPVPTAHIDPAQLEHALLNLCLNARDAMPDGGRLTITTAAEADDNGPHPVLWVADTGTGILPEHLGRVFEPFFSTKGEGKGSGLGLAMVYGFVTQSGGEISIDSNPGQGTTFKLRLPAATSGLTQQPPESPPPGPGPQDGHPSVPSSQLRGAAHGGIQGAPKGQRPAAPLAGDQAGEGGKTLLLVEDNDLVRQLALAQLESLGYRVLVARDASEALAILGGDTAVDLLFSDVLMPGLSGPDLVARARQLRPGLKALLTTGFAGQRNGTKADLTATAPVLHKPYRREDLAQRVREVLQGDT